jgi:hypothetical protein
MASAIESVMALWMWPFTMAKWAGDWAETMTSAHTVIDVRMPIISAAWTNPLAADQRELSLMVTEKAKAFGQSQRSISAAREKVRRASEANAHMIGRSGQIWLSWSEWTQFVERNLEIAATIAMLPTAALAPIHSKATANARRLRKS